MQRFKDIVLSLKPYALQCLALVVLVSCVVVYVTRFYPSVDPTPIAGVVSVKKLSEEELNAQPVVQKLKEELASELGFTPEEIFDEKKAETAVAAKTAEPVEEELVEETITVAQVDLPAVAEIIVAKPSIKKAPAKLAKTKASRRNIYFARIAPTQKLTATIKVPARTIPIDDMLAAVGLETSDAVDTVGPLDTLADSGLSETDPSQDFAISTWQATQLASAEPIEARLGLRVGMIQPEDFSTLSSSLEQMKQSDLTVSEPPAKLASRTETPAPATVSTETTPLEPIAKSEVAVVQPPPKTSDNEKSAGILPNLVFADRTPLAMMAKPEPVSPKTELEEVPSKEDASESFGPVVVIPDTRVSKESKVAMNTLRNSEPELATQSSDEKPEPVLVVPALVTPAPVVVPTPKLSMATQPKSPAPEPTLVEPKKETSSVPAPRKTTESTGSPTGDAVDHTRARKTVMPDPTLVEDPASEGGILNGFLRMDNDVLAWLASIKGHIELYAFPKESRSSNDMQFVNYHFPNEEFQLDTSKLLGAYRLEAVVYSPRSMDPISRVEFEQPIVRQSYRQQIRFYLRKSDLDRNAKAEVHRKPGHAPLRIAVFNALSGNASDATPVPNATVRFLHFPEWGTLVADHEGNVRLPSVPTNSQFLAEIAEPKLKPNQKVFPTQQVIMTGSGPTYVPVNIVLKAEVDFIQHQTSTLQREDQGLVVGRVFKDGSPIPAAGEQVGISYRDNKPFYFTSAGFADKTLQVTGGTGLFIYYNLQASLRTLFQKGTFSPVQLLVRPGYANYVALGRGGTRNLKGRLVDPFRGADLKGSMPEAEIRFIGDGDWETVSDEQGRFEFENLSLPDVPMTLQVNAGGYPKTLHSIPWNSHGRQKEISLFMAQEDVLMDKDPKATPVTRDPGMGTIIGGAEASSFENGNQCVYPSITLDNPVSEKLPNPQPVKFGEGPHPLLAEGKWTSRGLCLTRRHPGFKYYNLPPGRYSVRIDDETGKALRSHVVLVDNASVSIVVN